MAKRLFVGGLPFSVTDTQLNEIFSKVGTVVSANVIIDKFAGRSKGFGFVEMTTDEEADKAIKTLNESEIEGRKITVNEARPMVPRDDRGQGGGRDFRSGGGRGGRGGGRSSGQRRW